MLSTIEPKRKTLNCGILNLEGSSGIMISSRLEDDTKIAKLLAYYSSRNHNIYPVYKNDVVDNVTIDDMDKDSFQYVKAFFITKSALSKQHTFSEDEEI